jgi:hypothetical protein
LGVFGAFTPSWDLKNMLAGLPILGCISSDLEETMLVVGWLLFVGFSGGEFVTG